jgi:hypothetical protein
MVDALDDEEARTIAMLAGEQAPDVLNLLVVPAGDEYGAPPSEGQWEPSRPEQAPKCDQKPGNEGDAREGCPKRGLAAVPTLLVGVCGAPFPYAFVRAGSA